MAPAQWCRLGIRDACQRINLSFAVRLSAMMARRWADQPRACCFRVSVSAGSTRTEEPDPARRTGASPVSTNRSSRPLPTAASGISSGQCRISSSPEHVSAFLAGSLRSTVQLPVVIASFARVASSGDHTIQREELPAREHMTRSRENCVDDAFVVFAEPLFGPRDPGVPSLAW